MRSQPPGVAFITLITASSGDDDSNYYNNEYNIYIILYAKIKPGYR